MDQICDDLAAEHAVLDAVVADISEEQWSQQTPAEGWDIRDTIIHLVGADLAALEAVSDPEGFVAHKEEMLSGRTPLEQAYGGPADETGAATLAWWRESRSNMIDAFRQRGPKERIPWFGPDMSTLSFATARLMETWSHGIDVAETVGATIEPSDRLRHVCHIGVTTRGWSYVVRGMDVPEGAVRVELTSPSGEDWAWGPEDAADVVRGSALDFSLLVTQRKPPSALNLELVGDLAVDWAKHAQAFAGAPTVTDETRA